MAPLTRGSCQLSSPCLGLRVLCQAEGRCLLWAHCVLFHLQASLIVTEELHLITFETEVYHQGLKIDLEVSRGAAVGCALLQRSSSGRQICCASPCLSCILLCAGCVCLSMLGSSLGGSMKLRLWVAVECAAGWGRLWLDVVSAIAVWLHPS